MKEPPARLWWFLMKNKGQGFLEYLLSWRLSELAATISFHVRWLKHCPTFCRVGGWSLGPGCLSFFLNETQRDFKNRFGTARCFEESGVSQQPGQRNENLEVIWHLFWCEIPGFIMPLLVLPGTFIRSIQCIWMSAHAAHVSHQTFEECSASCASPVWTRDARQVYGDLWRD